MRHLLPTLLLTLAFHPSFAQQPEPGDFFVNSIGMKFTRIEPGSFVMGSGEGDLDEQPAHLVEFNRSLYVGIHEVTNAQYEAFDPSHKEIRGKLGFSKEDDEAAVFVSWNDAEAFTVWLSEKEGRPYRLPTEAEWEYFARAGTSTAYHTGEELPRAFEKNARQSWHPDKDRPHPNDIVSLNVGETPPNAWGIYDVHGNVEEWTLDWYGPYDAGGQVDPVGRASGDFKVTRGGSHSSDLYYLRSANRMGTLPADKHWLIGFRVVMGEIPASEPLPALPPTELHRLGVSQSVPTDVSTPIEGPYFRGPIPYVKLHPTEKGPFFYHNHQAAITETSNGDLLAIWYTTKEESGRYLAQAASRLRYGSESWEPASMFWDVPDRNDHGNALWWDGDQTIYHVSGLSAAATWGNLALIVRTSTDNGVTWSPAQIANPNHGLRNQVIASMSRARNGEIIVTADAVSTGNGGTAIHVSTDEGKTWNDPGGTIAGIHASVVSLEDGRLLAFGRGDNIDGRMPKSVSNDMGKTWEYEASPFAPLSSTQRLVLIRLQEGPLFFGSFADNMMFTDSAGNSTQGTGLFGAVSYDEGETWPVRKLITDGKPAHWVTTARSRSILMSPYTAEPRGYMAVTQARNGLIHLISSFNHYAFDLKWLEEPAAILPEASIPSRNALTNVFSTPENVDRWGTMHFRGEKTSANRAAHLQDDGTIRIQPPAGSEAMWVDDTEFSKADPSRGVTVEVKARVSQSSRPGRGLDILVHLGKGGRRGYILNIIPDGIWTHDAFSIDPIVQAIDNHSEMHTYRLTIQPDGLMWIFRDGEQVGIRSPATYRDDWAMHDGPYLRLGAVGGVEAFVESVGYELGID